MSNFEYLDQDKDGKVEKGEVLSSLEQSKNRKGVMKLRNDLNTLTNEKIAKEREIISATAQELKELSKQTIQEAIGASFTSMSNTLRSVFGALWTRALAMGKSFLSFEDAKKQLKDKSFRNEIAKEAGEVVPPNPTDTIEGIEKAKEIANWITIDSTVTNLFAVDKSSPTLSGDEKSFFLAIMDKSTPAKEVGKLHFNKKGELSDANGTKTDKSIINVWDKQYIFTIDTTRGIVVETKEVESWSVTMSWLEVIPDANTEQKIATVAIPAGKTLESVTITAGDIEKTITPTSPQTEALCTFSVTTTGEVKVKGTVSANTEVKITKTKMQNEDEKAITSGNSIQLKKKVESADNLSLQVFQDKVFGESFLVGSDLFGVRRKNSPSISQTSLTSEQIKENKDKAVKPTDNWFTVEMSIWINGLHMVETHFFFLFDKKGNFTGISTTGQFEWRHVPDSELSVSYDANAKILTMENRKQDQKTKKQFSIQQDQQTKNIAITEVAAPAPRGDITPARPANNKVENIESNQDYTLWTFNFPYSSTDKKVNILIQTNTSSNSFTLSSWVPMTANWGKETYTLGDDGVLKFKTTDTDSLPTQIVFGKATWKEWDVDNNKNLSQTITLSKKVEVAPPKAEGFLPFEVGKTTEKIAWWVDHTTFDGWESFNINQSKMDFMSQATLESKWYLSSGTIDFARIQAEEKKAHREIAMILPAGQYKWPNDTYLEGGIQKNYTGWEIKWFARDNGRNVPNTIGNIDEAGKPADNINDYGWIAINADWTYKVTHGQEENNRLPYNDYVSLPSYLRANANKPADKTTWFTKKYIVEFGPWNNRIITLTENDWNNARDQLRAMWATRVLWLDTGTPWDGVYFDASWNATKPLGDARTNGFNNVIIVYK